METNIHINKLTIMALNMDKMIIIWTENTLLIINTWDRKNTLFI
jgi:hypothetical protein